MTFRLDQVVPWGRSFDEYVAMFDLDQQDLGKRILGCGDGPASFNAVASKRGCRVVSADPIYRFTAAQIESRIAETATSIAEQLRRNTDEFVWAHFTTVDALIEARLSAMREFLRDFSVGSQAGRYIDAELPNLPFADTTFELALCSHFLLLYSEQHDADFHIAAILELCRIASEVRIFPLLELGSAPSRHLEQVKSAVRDRGFAVETRRVAYEMQKGGNQMLRIRSLGEARTESA